MARPTAKVIPFRRKRWTRGVDYGASDRRPRRREFKPIMVMAPLAAFTAVLLWGGSNPTAGLDTPKPTAIDREAQRFGICGGSGARDNCVIDGDTFWYEGDKIRISDIDTPEVSQPRCAEEAELGAAATDRLHALLNDGPFTLEPNDDGTGRDRDRYGRLLRTVTRDGESLGDTLVDEGLAEEWGGYRGGWC